jgi:hypothetical protein
MPRHAIIISARNISITVFIDNDIVKRVVPERPGRTFKATWKEFGTWLLHVMDLIFLSSRIKVINESNSDTFQQNMIYCPLSIMQEIPSTPLAALQYQELALTGYLTPASPPPMSTVPPH